MRKLFLAVFGGLFVVFLAYFFVYSTGSCVVSATSSIISDKFDWYMPSGTSWDIFYSRCVFKKAEKNIEFCFDKRNIFGLSYPTTKWGSVNTKRFPKDCIVNYAEFNQDPDSCFHNSLVGFGDPTAAYSCYENAGGVLTKDVCAQFPKQEEKYCLDRAGIETCKDCV